MPGEDLYGLSRLAALLDHVHLSCLHAVHIDPCAASQDLGCQEPINGFGIIIEGAYLIIKRGTSGEDGTYP